MTGNSNAGVEIPAALVMRRVDADIEVLVSSQADGNPYHPDDREHFDGSGLYCEAVIKKQQR